MTNKKHKNETKPFKWKPTQGELILWLVCWYCWYALSFRDLQEIAQKSGLTVNRSAVYRWVQEYAPEINKRFKPHYKQTSASWKCDETYIKIKGKWYYLYRAIDKNGETLKKFWATCILLIPGALLLIKAQPFHLPYQNFKPPMTCLVIRYWGQLNT